MSQDNFASEIRAEITNYTLHFVIEIELMASDITSFSKGVGEVRLFGLIVASLGKVMRGINLIDPNRVLV